jgi:hypothetical protein
MFTLTIKTKTKKKKFSIFDTCKNTLFLFILLLEKTERKALKSRCGFCINKNIQSLNLL